MCACAMCTEKEKGGGTCMVGYLVEQVKGSI